MKIMLNSDELYRMKLHEDTIAVDSNLITTVIRVPGGWIYNSYDKGNQILSSCFVPYCNEFLGKKARKVLEEMEKLDE